MHTESGLPSPSRALVTLVSQPNDAHPHRSYQRVSTFVTQLIANARQLPQTRACPADVIAAYRATVERIQKLNDKSE